MKCRLKVLTVALATVVWGTTKGGEEWVYDTSQRPADVKSARTSAVVSVDPVACAGARSQVASVESVFMWFERSAAIVLRRVRPQWVILVK